MRDPRQRLIVAIVFALLVGGGVFYYMRSQQAALQQAKKKIKPMSILYTASPIPARTVLKEEMIKVKEVPQAAVTPSMFRADQKEEVVGKVTIAAFIADEPITKEKIAEKGAQMGLAFIVPRGKRAFTIKVDASNGLAYLLKPGDYVDIVSKFEAGFGGKKEETTELSTVIVQNAQVLALDQQMEVVQETDQQGKEKPKKLEYQYVTLAVDPEDVAELNLLDRIAENRLVLRAVNDFQKRPQKVASLVSIVKRRKLPVFTMEDETKRKKRVSPEEGLIVKEDLSELFSKKAPTLPGVPTPEKPAPQKKAEQKPPKKKIKVYKGISLEEVEIQ